MSDSPYTPTEVIDRLKKGNERFQAGTPSQRISADEIRMTRSGQEPLAFVLGCIDSRVPVERVFDQGIGDLFVGRVAGNVLNDDLITSMEFACGVAGAKTIIVLGHTRCGAVAAALAQQAEGEEIDGLLGRLAEVAEQVRAGDVPEDDDFPDRVSEANVDSVVASIRNASPLLLQLERSGAIALAGAIYDVTDGSVRFL